MREQKPEPAGDRGAAGKSDRRGNDAGVLHSHGLSAGSLRGTGDGEQAPLVHGDPGGSLVCAGDPSGQPLDRHWDHRTVGDSAWIGQP